MRNKIQDFVHDWRRILWFSLWMQTNWNLEKICSKNYFSIKKYVLRIYERSQGIKLNITYTRSTKDDGLGQNEIQRWSQLLYCPVKVRCKPIIDCLKKGYKLKRHIQNRTKIPRYFGVDPWRWLRSWRHQAKQFDVF